MQVSEKNELIAKFLGWKQGKDLGQEDRWREEWFDKNAVRKTDGVRQILSFHFDWSELMEVVEKIKATQRSEFSPDTFPVITISDNGCNIKFNGNNPETIVDVSGAGRIECTYEACIEFIKWRKERGL